MGKFRKMKEPAKAGRIYFSDKSFQMPATTARKLRIKEGDTLLTINAPADFKKSLGPVPDGVRIINSGRDFDQVHWFVKDKGTLEKGLSKIASLVKAEIICWIYYPKGSSGIQTDLNRDNGWDLLMKQDFQWISLISFDATWSVFGIREKTEADRKKASRPKERPVFDYIDPVKKIVRLPEDLSALLKKNKKEEAFFNTLSFSNKKEYVEWVVSAKREETRATRVKETVERLEKGWKNPANR